MEVDSEGESSIKKNERRSSTSTKKQSKREYLPEEIPSEYREKPQHSYSHLIATALREAAPAQGGMTLSDIYKEIQRLFPYYEYCPHGWQNSVRHNLSSNKAFKKIAKEGKGWLWGLDEEYFNERERQKKKTQELQAAKSKAAAAAALNRSKQQQLKLQQQQEQLRLQKEQDKSVEDKNVSEIKEEIDNSIAKALDKMPIKKEREKTIAELAREIEVQRSRERSRPNYASMTRESLATSRVTSESTSPEVEGPSIQAQLLASAQSRQKKSGSPQTQPSLSAGQNIFKMEKMPSNNNNNNNNNNNTNNAPTPLQSLQQQTNIPQMRVQPQPSVPSSEVPKKDSLAAQISGLQLSPDTLKALALLQKKISEQLQGTNNSEMNPALLTKVLALVIAQAAKKNSKDGKVDANAITSLLNGKNPAKLAQMFSAAINAMKKKNKKDKAGSPVPKPSEETSSTKENSHVPQREKSFEIASQQGRVEITDPKLELGAS